MKRLLMSTGNWGFVLHQSSLFVPGNTILAGRRKLPCAQRKALREVLNVCITSAGFRSGSRDNPPLPTQIVDLAKRWTACIRGFAPFMRKACGGRQLQGLGRSCAAQRATLFSGRSIPVTRASLMEAGCQLCPTARPRCPWHRHSSTACPGIGHRHGDQLVQVLPGGDRRGLRDLLQRSLEPPDAPPRIRWEQFLRQPSECAEAIGSLPIRTLLPTRSTRH